MLTAADKVVSQNPEITIQVDGGSGTAADLQVKAVGSGPEYRWLVFTIRNVDRQPVSRLVAVGQDGVTGTGLYERHNQGRAC